MQSDPYRLFEALGIWAGAVATFAAVVVSLRLARRAERPRLAVKVDQWAYIDPAKVSDPGNVRVEDFPDVIVLTVTNLGLTRARIDSVYWHWFLLRGKGALQNPPERHERTPANWPSALDHGDQLQWILQPHDLVPKISSDMLARNWWWRLKLQLLCVMVSTSTGHHFRARLGPTLKKSFAVETKRLRGR
jgi:hypothetical protein